MEVFLVWLLFVVAIGSWASSRGRSFLGWVFIAIIFTPILAAIGLLILPRREDGPVAVIASSLNSLSDAMNRKSIELRAQRELQKERQDEEASKAEVERMTKLILARASHQSPNHASAQPSNPMFPESSSPVFGKRR